MNIKSLRPTRRAALLGSLLLLGPILSGCGGGGSTGSAPTAQLQPATVTLSGTLLDTSGAPLVGYKVIYAPGATTTPHMRRAEDSSGTISAITDAHGFYTLSIPASQTATAATLTVFDTTGTQVQSQTITLNPSQPVQTTVTTVPTAAPADPTPPPPPAAPTL